MSMKIVDLTHIIEACMPVYPGTEPPRLDQANTIAKNGFAEKAITLYSHTGTHMDAPAHMLAHGRTLDTYVAADFYGRAVLADFSASDFESIGVEHLMAYESLLRNADFLILRTGWAERWGKADYFAGFPVLTPEAARWVIALGIRGIGVDAISIDCIEDTHFPIHNLLFKAGLFIIENLTHLDRVGTEFYLGSFPLYIKDADGSPARAVAFIS
jgi:arylformamidase